MMKEEDKLDNFWKKIRIPSDQEVEAAGLRFDKRLRRVKSHRWMVWASSSVAVILVVAILVTLLFEQLPKREMVDNTKIAVPTLILSNGNSVKLDRGKIEEKIHVANVQIMDKHISYDSQVQTETIDSMVKKVEYNTLVIPAGYTYDVTLVDGSRVTLNAGSRLTYPVEFSGELREVELSGEAYFQIEKSEKPFEVNVLGSKIRVYGTRFNVKTLQRNNTLETVLVEGSIGFTSSGQDEVKIVPGEQVIFDIESGKIDVQQVDTRNITAWRDGVFRYQDRKLNLVLEDISAWYDIDFESRIDVTHIEVTMNLSKETPIDEVVSFLELMTNCKIIKEGGYYVIK